jgi:biotin synthase-related radical SAM superfamily protein
MEGILMPPTDKVLADAAVRQARSLDSLATSVKSLEKTMSSMLKVIAQVAVVFERSLAESEIEIITQEKNVDGTTTVTYKEAFDPNHNKVEYLTEFAHLKDTPGFAPPAVEPENWPEPTLLEKDKNGD